MTNSDTPPVGNAAVIHDGSVHPGGAVQVSLEAARALDADLYIGFSGKDKTWWEERTPNDVEILTSRTKGGTLTDIRTAWRFLNLSLNEYDVVLTSGPATKFFQPYDNQYHIHYLHHPPLGSLWYDGGFFGYAVKTLDRIETHSIPAIVTNSELTAERVYTQYGIRPTGVVHPPVEVDRFDHTAHHAHGEFVMVGRLEDRKRPQVAVDAFRQLADEYPDDPPRLHLVGDGPLKADIERDAPDNVIVHGYVDDEELKTRVEQAWGGVFMARREDFGVTPIEYMAAGLPVVGVDEQNTNNQVVDGETGTLVEPTPEGVCEGVTTVLNREWDRETIKRRAQKYGTERFHTEIQDVVRQTQSGNCQT